MWELDYKESWAPKNWYFWTEVLEKTLESPLDCKEIQPDYPKGNQSWMFLWKDWCWSWNSNTLATWWEELTHLKRPSCWERLRAGGEGDDRGWDGWMVSPTQWTWVWVGSGSWWWTRSQRVRHDWVTELTISSFILKLYLFQIRSVGAPKAAPESFWPISSISLFAAMTKHYGLDGLSSSRNVFLTSLEAGNSRCWSIWFLMRYLLSAAAGHLLSVSSHRKRDLSCLTSLFLIALIHHKGSTLMIYLSPKGSTCKCHRTGVRSSPHGLGGDILVHRIYGTEVISSPVPHWAVRSSSGLNHTY